MMNTYKHTQVGYLMLCITLIILVFFAWLQISARAEPLNQITSVRSARNHWYYGWGVKVWFWPYMWIYNVSGFDAVEIVMKNGKIYRVGTDTPGELEAAIKQAITT